ncbi:MAG: hypothetical protein U9Q40_10185 [Campylobacterota bacterium]|nr:hypothetical protein [Campylobacterota bacterium]
MKNLTITLLLLSIILLGACTNKHKKEVMKEEFRLDLNTTKQKQVGKKAIETVEVSAENFHIDTLTIPDRENIKRVKILGAQLNDVIALLTEATDQDIIFQLQSDALSQYSGSANNTNSGNSINNLRGQSNTGNGSTNNGSGYENNDEYQIRQSKVYYAASNVGFGRLLKKSVGDKLSIRYDDGTYYLGYVKTVTLKIPSLSGLADAIKNTLRTLGARNVVHDPITSSLTFSAREKEYLDIMKYLTILRNNLYVIEYEIAIYDVELKDNYALGIDWNLLVKGDHGIDFVTQTISSLGGATTAPAAFGTIVDTGRVTGTAMAEALTEFGKVESIQKPKLLGIAGTDVTLIDGLEEPYIKELKSTAIGDNSVQTSTVAATALSGLKITLNSNIMDGTVLTDISLEINNIVGYTDFEVDGVSYSQPRTHTKNINNSMRVQPGEPIVISGLFRHKSDKGYKGIPGVAQTAARIVGGSENESTTKSEMVIIVTPRVIKYVMK